MHGLTIMRNLLLLSAMLLPCVTLPVNAALPTEVNGQQLPSLSSMLERVTPAVVNISTEGRQNTTPAMLNDPFFKRFFGDSLSSENPMSGTGSGVIIHAQLGHVLTNFHVIEAADTIFVTLNDGRRFPANVLGADPHADLAVLQIPPERLVAMRFGDSERLRVGDFVVAIGNPYGIGQTVTSGIISALHRNPGISEYENFIQTDAPINLGNSGGPLVNLRGELIGINTAILGDQSGGNLGIGFAVPINTAAGVITQIVQHGHVERGQLGLEVQDLDSESARNAGIKPNGGAIVRQIIAGSAAEKAGVQTGDIIVRLNSKEINTAADVKNRVGNAQIGEKVYLNILRGGKPRNITVVIGAAGKNTPPPPANAPAAQSSTGRPFWERGLQ
ncbi:MAG: peptidase [Thiothrix lacustris]|uniref:Peptidase n=2 Tax=Thiothrix TaxID=1030 RepID=A0A1Y1QN26_9GAMM|nr:MAG: peptidase [Thiothrix lacustris]